MSVTLKPADLVSKSKSGHLMCMFRFILINDLIRGDVWRTQFVFEVS